MTLNTGGCPIRMVHAKTAKNFAKHKILILCEFCASFKTLREINSFIFRIVNFLKFG